jgi:F0F1-type ATP synthase assembly protein I
MSRRNLASDLVIGAAAGAAATWLMDEATTALYESESEEVRDREDDARGDKTAYEIAAEKAAKLAGKRLKKAQRKQIGQAIHWSLGIGAGVIYGALRNQFRGLGIGSGLAYGVVFWLAMDEGANTLLGLTPPPNAFPWQTHARGLAGHLVLGAAVEAVFDVADAI